jgi:hypothetical protein
MKASSTLLFVCDQVQQYENFISEFRAVETRILIARNLTQAKTMLLGKPADGIVIRHDSAADDRPLAAKLKRIAPRTPVFLITDQKQQPLAAVDSIWRGELNDRVVARAIALLFRHLFQPSEALQTSKLKLRESNVFLNALAARASG